MSEHDLHGEWLSLLEVSGPFLAQPVLRDAFQQGLEGLDPDKRKDLRQAYDEWREALDLDDPDLEKLHRAWIAWVLTRTLEFGEYLRPPGAFSETIRCELPEHDISLTPDFVLSETAKAAPLLLVMAYDAEVGLQEPFRTGSYAASPAERAVELCRATGVRLALVTNGERWMLVDAPVGAVTSLASWYARLWLQEPVTLQAFVGLLWIRRFFLPEDQRLSALIDRSLTYQDEVTDALGEQVRRAVEVLTQALDRADVDRGRELLKGIEPAELYEAGLTVMMRIVFLLSAEERGLLLMGDPLYETGYAVSTLRMQLRAESDEVLERRWDAWSRLLSLFRIVFGGVEHPAMRLPALGGSLFDPDRFPFLEGRAPGSDWRSDLATPVPIDNRTVLLLLEAVQLFQGRTLSYLALDVEQIGYVYEGLLERTVVRAEEVTLDLRSAKDADKPWALLSELDDAVAEGAEAVEALLKERTESSITRIQSDLAKPVDDETTIKLLSACHGDASLRDRVQPYARLLKVDSWGYPLVYPAGTFRVASGTDRRETGTHYTPKSFTEAIVRETLEPLVYVGPSEGTPREAWKLKAPSDLLQLKICDPAMGSGAFLVQVCRWLAERLVEAWRSAESGGQFVTAEGEVRPTIDDQEPLRDDAEERLLVARRLIAERCLYGADMNPLAVELAKLSIWLVTLAKGRPFGFLDHNLRCGDSLLGITSLDQLRFLEMKPGPNSSTKLFASTIDTAIAEAIRLRSEIRQHPIRDIADVRVMSQLNEEAQRALRLPDLGADALIAAALGAKGRPFDTARLSIEVGAALAGTSVAENALRHKADKGLATDVEGSERPRIPLHWPLQFPEVFVGEQAGFDAFVGNPPFVGGQMLSGNFGPAYQAYLVEYLSYEEKASVDLVVFFFLRIFRLLAPGSTMGLLARRSISEGRNRDAGLTQLLSVEAKIYSAQTNIRWPGKASVVVHRLHITNGEWMAVRILDGAAVQFISSELGSIAYWQPQKLSSNEHLAFQGTILLGEGFKLSEQDALTLLEKDKANEAILFRFLGGNEINKKAEMTDLQWVINFWDWPEKKAEVFSEAFDIVRRNVKPERDKNTRKARRDKWWIYGETASGLYHAIGAGSKFSRKENSGNRAKLRRVIAISTGVTKYPAFTLLEPDYVYSNKLCIVADERFSIFATLCSDIHSVWAWAQKTSLGGDLYSLVYVHGNIFETFPFPEGMLGKGDEELEKLGRAFFESRQRCMLASSSGLTKFYNEFHNPLNTSSNILECRHIQESINCALGARYGWSDVDLSISFVEVGYLPNGKNLRLTISEESRLKIRRLLANLNRDRYNVDYRGANKRVSRAAASVDMFQD